MLFVFRLGASTGSVSTSSERTLESKDNAGLLFHLQSGFRDLHLEQR